MSNSDHKAGRGEERLSVAQTCNRLSRLLKERGSFGDINLGITGKLDVKGPETSLTMNLAPMEVDQKQNDTGASRPNSGPSNSAGDAADKAEIRNLAPLTIFYGGQIVVYDNFPSDKAKEIMELAKQGSPEALAKTVSGPGAPEKARSDNNTLPDLNAPSTEAVQPRQPQLADRIARRASLHRFFAKRKDRAVARAPYNVNHQQNTAPKPPEETPRKVEGGQSSLNAKVGVPATGEKSNVAECDGGKCSSNLELRL